MKYFLSPKTWLLYARFSATFYNIIPNTVSQTPISKACYRFKLQTSISLPAGDSLLLWHSENFLPPNSKTFSIVPSSGVMVAVDVLLSLIAGSRRETVHSWQRSWGRRLGIHKGGIEPQECPRIFSNIYPQKTRVYLLYCFVFSPLTLLGAVPHHHLTLSVKELTYSSN